MRTEKRPAAPAKKRAKAKSKAKPKANGHAKETGVERFVIREVAAEDLDALYDLSAHLDSVNFPHDRAMLAKLIDRSTVSFQGKKELDRGQYMFVMQGIDTGRVAGTSMIFSQHGQSDAPHIFFDVVQDERYSATLDRHFSHTTLRLGFNYRGPTEIGALVLDPVLRAHGLGKQLSYVRFLFIAMFRERFQRTVIAELMPPLLEDGRSLLWENLGKHFTGLTYQEADKLSHTNKEFITSLFPQTPLYASLLPEDVRAMIGQVGEETKGVRRMLEAIGFEYSERIDPFDGGPHFEAPTDSITLVQNARRGLVSTASIDDADENAELAWRRGPDHIPAQSSPVRSLVGTASEKGPCKFRAMIAAIRRDGKSVTMSKAVQKALGLKPGSAVWTVPI